LYAALTNSLSYPSLSLLQDPVIGYVTVEGVNAKFIRLLMIVGAAFLAILKLPLLKFYVEDIYILHPMK